MAQSEMVKKEKVFFQATPKKVLSVDRIKIDASDSSLEALTAFKKILKDDAEVFRQIYAPLDDAIDEGRAIKEARSVGNQNSKKSKARIKARIDSRVLTIIRELKSKKIEPPTLKEIMRAYEEKFKPETISKSRIEAAQRTINK